MMSLHYYMQSQGVSTITATATRHNYVDCTCTGNITYEACQESKDTSRVGR